MQPVVGYIIIIWLLFYNNLVTIRIQITSVTHGECCNVTQDINNNNNNKKTSNGNQKQNDFKYPYSFVSV